MSKQVLDPVHELMRAEVRSLHLERLLTDTLHILYGLLLLCVSPGGMTPRKAARYLKAKVQGMPGGYWVARHLAELDAQWGYELEAKGVYLACWVSERLKGAKK